jgi:hypothetical protein
LIEGWHFRKESGDKIHVRMGGPSGEPVEMTACRLYFQGLDVRSGGDRFDLGDRKKTGYVTGRNLAPRRVGRAEIHWMRVPRIHLTIQPKKVKRGDPKVIGFDCRVDQRRPNLWMFTVLAEGQRPLP